jgi:hypothetical protein
MINRNEMGCQVELRKMSAKIKSGHFAKIKMRQRGLKWKVSDPLSIPSHKEPLIWNQAESNYGSGTMPQFIFLAAETERSVLLHPAFIV